MHWPCSMTTSASWESVLDLLSEEPQVCLFVRPSQGLVLSPDRTFLAHSCHRLLNSSRKSLSFPSNNAPWTQSLVRKYVKIVYRGQKYTHKSWRFYSLPFPLDTKATLLLYPSRLPSPPSNKQMQSRRNLFWTNSAKQFNNAILYKNT